ncbi:hypothetical protein [uncultured Corynebacterium sp.]|uniref:hypothetical protein n=1 Tax=uncultured Corynebacterium sp. TaxID=159447 RepID=UPI0028E43AB7|nr:hypothetical protein [uncultured Corynebacterium sp.]
MDFNRHGVPGCSINDTYEHFIDTWRDVTLTEDCIRGTVTLNGNDYYAVADLDPVTGETVLLDLNFPEHRNDEWDTIEGIELQTCSARLLAARLSLLDPPAYFNLPCVEWPKAHMAFFVFEDVPRTICWYKA